MGKDINLRLSANNLHLKNIFTDEYYIELGNIEISVIERILSKELVKIDEVAYFPIQNKGLGHSSLTNNELKNILPYLYFKNLNDKDISKQLFITYGLVKYKNNDKEEIFVPIVLLPIKIYFEEGQIYIQLISRPIKNPFLLKIFNDNKNYDLVVDKLDTIYEIDRLCMSFSKIAQFELKLENYLTFAFVKKKETIINQNKFQMLPDNSNEYFDKIIPNRDEIYFSDLLNKRQRKAVIASMNGSSFSIVGRGGCGKTTTLKNVLVNAVNQGKKVLYISNMKETLDDVETFLNENGLGRIVANFSKPYRFLYDENEVIKKEESSDNNIDELYESLTNKYHIINNFEDKLSKRIFDYRFIDIINEIAYVTQENPKLLDIDDLSNIYKNEYKEIENKLCLIEESLKHIESFKDSIWKEIPIINNIMYPEQIITLIKNIYKCFVRFEEEKKVLENKFLVKKIDNYAMLKNVIFNLESLDIKHVPTNWKEEDLNTFRKAQDEYKNLKHDIYSYQELEYNLEHKYCDTNTIDIDSEVKTLFGSYYSEKDAQVINKLLEDKNSMMVRINRGIYQKENYEKSVAYLENFMNVSFHENRSNEYIKELLKLTDFLRDNHFNRRFINIVNNKQFHKVYERVLEAVDSISEANKNIEAFATDHPKLTLSNLKEISKIMDDYSELSEQEKKEDTKTLAMLKKRLGNGSIESLIFQVKSYFNNVRILKREKEEYYDLLKERYTPNDKSYEKLKVLNDYIYGIRDKNIRTVIIKVLYKINEKEVDGNESRIYKILNTFKKSYYELEDLAELFKKYNMTFDDTCFNIKVNQIDSAINYIKDLYQSNERLKKVVKNKDNEYVSVETYLHLQQLLNEKNNLKQKLINNQKYIECYGDLYQGEKTDITKISRVLQNFQLFCENFINSHGFLKALNEAENTKLLEYLGECKKVNDDINEVFKMYCRIFKDGVSRYYYTSFRENIEYLNTLQTSKSELIHYLSITKGLGVLNKYGLEKLINYIIKEPKCENLVNNFKYTYFKNAEKLYLQENPELVNYMEIVNDLKDIINLESKMIKINRSHVISHILHNSSNKTYVSGVKNLDYQSYLKKTSSYKKVALSTTDIAGLFLSPDDFDLVIIDDGQLNDVNEYGDFVNANQVIIAGELQTHATISNSLISRVRNFSSIYLDYRYLPTPKNLQKKYNNVRGIIKENFHDNVGLEIVEAGLYEYIYNLYKNNYNVNLKINYFTKGINRQREFFEEFSEFMLLKGAKNEEIVYCLTDMINVSDLNDEYLFNSNYNILDFESYYDIDVDYINDNLISLLLLCKDKLVIYDNRLLLNKDYSYRFFCSIKNILDDRNIVFEELNADRAMYELNECIRKNDIESYYVQDNEIVMVRNNKLQTIMVIWGDSSPNEALNYYRDNVRNYVMNNYKVRVIPKNTLVIGLSEVAFRLVRGKNV